MNELSIFTGAGGGLLGTKLLGWKAIGYVEWEPYCQAVLAQRIKDGFLEEAPIFGDIREFVKSGAAREYRGFADVVTAGFPCQPFSVAGKQLAHADERNMWPATADVLCEVRPRYALLENVPGLLATGYCERIFADLAAMGFDARWGVFSASECGAPHERGRLFILADSRHGGGRRAESVGQEAATARNTCAGVVNAPSAGLEGTHNDRETPSRIQQESGERCAEMADSAILRQSGQGPSGDAFHPTQEGNRQGTDPVNGSWWRSDPAESSDAESFVGRVADGVADRVERLKAIGNGQVPAVVVRAWRELSK